MTKVAGDKRGTVSKSYTGDQEIGAPDLTKVALLPELIKMGLRLLRQMEASAVVPANLPYAQEAVGPE